MGIISRIIDKRIEKRVEQMGLAQVEKSAGFMPLETAAAPGGRIEQEQRVDAGTFIDAFKSLPWIYAAGMAIAIAASKAPIQIYREKRGSKDKADTEEVTGQAINELLLRPNPETSWLELLQMTCINLVVTGEQFWNLVGTKEGQPISKANPPVEIWWMKPEAMDLEANLDGTVKRYWYVGPTGREIPLDPSEVIHFRLPNPDSYFRGLSMLEPLKNTLIQEFNAVAFNKAFLQNDGRPPIIIEHPGEPSKEQRRSFWAAWDERHKGVAKQGRAGMIWGGMKVSQLGTSPKDAQYIEMRKMNREESLAALMTPPSMVGLLEYANYSNMDVQNKKFISDAVLPVLAIVAGKMTLKLFPLFDLSYRARFDETVFRALFEDDERSATIASLWITNGIKSPNDIRAEMKLPPYDGGDIYYLPMNLVGVGGKDYGKPEPPPPPVPPAAPVPPVDGTPPADANPPADTPPTDIAPPKKTLPAPAHRDDEPAEPEKKPSFWRNDEKRQVLWEAFVKRVDQRGKAMSPAVEKYLRRQAEKVKEAATRAKFPSELKAEKLFDIGKEGERYAKDFYARYLEAFCRAGQAGFDATKGMIYIEPEERKIKAIDDFIPRPEQIAKLKAGIQQAAEFFNQTTFDIIKDDLLKAESENWTVEETTQELWRHLDELSPSSARRISRTEMGRVENWGQVEGYRENEFVDMKGWMCSFVPDSRDAHMEADGQEVKLGDDFKVGAKMMSYPGDPKGGPENDCNCLCGTYPVVGNL